MEKIVLNISSEIKSELKKLAKKKGLTLNGYLRMIFIDLIERGN